MFNVSTSFIHDHKAEPIDIAGVTCTWREALQSLGTEWGRTYLGPHVWIDLCKLRVIQLAQHKKRPRIVISDCRFTNEWHAFEYDPRFDTRLVAIYRPDAAAAKMSHASERDIAALEAASDLFIPNTGSIPDLHHTLDSWLERETFIA